MCFDKTGTLTEEGLDNYGIISAKYSNEEKLLKFSKIIKPSNIPLLGQQHKKFPVSQLPNSKINPFYTIHEIMATCHSLTMVKGQIIGDPLDIKMFEATEWIIEDDSAKIN